MNALKDMSHVSYVYIVIARYLLCLVQLCEILYNYLFVVICLHIYGCLFITFYLHIYKLLVLFICNFISHIYKRSIY